MPMLYGEGQKAFLRLQEEIVRTSPDLSIFAWKDLSSRPVDHEGPIACSIFASAAADFSDSGSFTAIKSNSTNDFFISNQGIKLHTRLPMHGIPKQQGYQHVFPVCKIDGGNSLAIRLRKCGASQLVREDPWTLVELDFLAPSAHSRTMYILVRLPPAHFPKYLLRDIVLHSRSHILQIAVVPNMIVNGVWPWSRWDATDQVFFVSDNLGLDYAAAKINKRSRVHTHKGWVDVHFNFMLYSLGWANTNSGNPFYTIVPWKPSDGILKDLNEKLEQYDYSTSMTKDNLDAYGIPISSSAKDESADTGYSMTVDCTSRLVNDQTKCLVPFWRLELSMKVEKTLI